MPEHHHFRVPFTPPQPHEARALAVAAAFLRRAATELDSRRLSPFPSFDATSLSGDLSSNLISAGALCETVVELASNAGL